MILEKKRIAIEVNKQVMDLIPNVNTVCEAQAVSSITLRVSCHTKNMGKYHVNVKIDEKILLSHSDDIAEKRYGAGFEATFPERKNSFVLPPSSEGDLWFYIKFENKKHPQGVNLKEVVSLVNFSYSTSDIARDFIINQFPETKEMIFKISNTTKRIFVIAYK
ncbi:hypothetical protein MMP66_16200 [Acinetobacter dispersus]|uniref:hypothetical protein n=1 Tax=Acinetobacter dispersus TaxID=70348 RepID=UPI001F4B67BE|nr:hypothetical protein [Acinetobacter dispersus]MCH7395796.1 hypothetical protein [Acinetobacter dispersus]